MEIPQYFHFNSFSLAHTMKTRTITYFYFLDTDEIRHTGRVKISDKLYNILDSLTLFIPSDSNDSNNVDYSLIIGNSTNNNHTHIFLTVHPATAQYEIVNKIDLDKISKLKKNDQYYENTDIVVISASEHKSLIGQSKITMTNKYMPTSLDRQRFNQDKIKIYKLDT